MSTHSSLKEARAPSELKGLHVFAIMSVFFGFMFVVNGIFLYAALKTHPGDQVENAYRLGIDYNRTLDARAIQTQAGWRAAIGLADAEMLQVNLYDRDGTLLDSKSPVLSAVRKGDTAPPQILPLTASGSGAFKADISALAPGVWDFSFQADVLHETTPARFSAHKTLDLR